MKLNLGAKIRELRRRYDRTQDNLAEALGVSAQAVSRWETGGSYPDMEMIPAVANYFHISIDELFGYHDEREEKIKSTLQAVDTILTKCGFTMYQGSLSDDVGECIDMLRAAAEEFPDELFDAHPLFQRGDHSFHHRGNYTFMALKCHLLAHIIAGRYGGIPKWLKGRAWKARRLLTGRKGSTPFSSAIGFVSEPCTFTITGSVLP